MAIRAYQPPKQLQGERLDLVLSKIDNTYSRSSWQKLIKQTAIRVGGQTVRDPSVKFNGGIIEFDPPDEILAPANDIPIIYEDDDVVVFDKPAGVLTHSKGQLYTEWTLADAARPKVADDDSNRPGIVHRLDRDTSGVIVVAKNPKSKMYLQKQFAKRQVEKLYLALVKGKIETDKQVLDWPLARHPAKPSTWTTSPNGKTAETELKVLTRLSDVTLVELRPKTGRTHQLRVHLQKLGHPILGDRLYGEETSANRLMLHAKLLSLRLPNGQSQTFEAPLPPDFKDELNRYEQA